MQKQKRLNNDTIAQLGVFGILPVGFERYESAAFLIEGTRGADYRWRLTFRDTGKVCECSMLVEALGLIRAAVPAEPTKKDGTKNVARAKRL